MSDVKIASTKLGDNRVLDLFSGPGGLGSGFGKYFSVETAIDNNADAVKTYSHNHKETKVYEKDIINVDFTQKDYDGIIAVVGGPPCQDFSTRNKFRDVKSKRADLVNEMLRSINEIKPEFGLIENVATIPKVVKLKVISTLEKLGYKVVGKVVNGANYGSVQLRRRWILTFSSSRYIYPLEGPANRTAKEILDINRVSEMNPTAKVLKSLQDPNLATGKWVSLSGQSYKSYFIIDENKLLPTIVNPSKSRFVAPNRKGYLSHLEIARAQGFPDTYKFFGNISSISQQLANAVPIEVAEKFASAFAGVGSNQTTVGEWF